MTRATALLVAGYALAVPGVLRLRSIMGARDPAALVQLGAIEAGHLLVATGWALKGRRVRAAVNVAAVLAYPAAWLASAPRAAS